MLPWFRRDPLTFAKKGLGCLHQHRCGQQYVKGPSTASWYTKPHNFSSSLFLASLDEESSLTPVIVQAAGAALVGRAASSEYQGNSDSPLTYAQANNVLIAGLALQVGTWVIFLIFLLVAMYRAFTFESLKSPVYRRMKSMLWVILGTTLLILMRACYRLSESIYGESLSSKHRV